jgi:4a-hydroxytetrahydrobiopterin dehydratase
MQSKIRKGPPGGGAGLLSESKNFVFPPFLLAFPVQWTYGQAELFSPSMSDIISSNEIKTWLKRVPNWETAQKGKAITRTFEFEDFTRGIDFINGVAEIAEEQEHHPDIDIRYNVVTLLLTTQSEGGLTEADFEMAKSIDNLVD